MNQKELNNENEPEERTTPPRALSSIGDNQGIHHDERVGNQRTNSNEVRPQSSQDESARDAVQANIRITVDEHHGYGIHAPKITVNEYQMRGYLHTHQIFSAQDKGQANIRRLTVDDGQHFLEIVFVFIKFFQFH